MNFAKVPGVGAAINLDCVSSFNIEKKSNSFVIVACMNNGDRFVFNDLFHSSERAMRCLFEFLVEAKND